MTKKQENLPAVQIKTFKLNTVDTSSLQLNSELEAFYDDSDKEGFEVPTGTIPIASIRQKDKKGEDGRSVVASSGDFRIYDRISEANNTVIPDVPGIPGLEVIILGDQTSRIYFEIGVDKPICKSLDGINGISDKLGGQCSVCPKNRFGFKPEKTDTNFCKQQMNLLVWDINSGHVYVLRLGPSGLTPYNNLKAFHYNNLKAFHRKISTNAPLHSFVIEISTEYEGEAQFPYYKPVFKIGRQIDVDLFLEVKEARKASAMVFTKTVSIDEPDETTPLNSDDPGGEVPPGVEPVFDKF